MLLHGDLHAGNVLDGGWARGQVAIDPRPCLGEPAVDGERAWQWWRAFAAMLAAATAMGGGPAERVAALLEVAP